jgi:hypothetical protein
MLGWWGLRCIARRGLDGRGKGAGGPYFVCLLWGRVQQQSREIAAM